MGVFGELPARVVERLKTSIYADTSQGDDALKIGLIGGDIPIFPPIAFFLLVFLALLPIITKNNRLRFVPRKIAALPIRMALFAFGVALALKLARAADAELGRVGTTPNFSAVIKIATQGPFAYTRNAMYISGALCQVSLAIALDSAWMLLSMLFMFMYLHIFVVPAEEAFLTRQIGEDYLEYCETTPRWLF